MKKLLYLFLCLCIGFQMKAQTVVDIVVASPNHNTLEAAVIAAELADDLSGPGPFTVFAPTDAAFAALPAGTVDALLADPTGDLANILLYHVLGLQALSTDLTNGMMVTTLQGEEIVVTIDMNGVFINNAQVTVADIQASNGVVHVIDAVLLPPVMPTNSIMDIVAGSDVHNTLEAALVASGLNETLANPGDFTLFAPTDAAFAALPAGAVDALLADPFGGLVDVLLYHALGGTALSTDLADGLMVTTLQGQDVTVTINANGVFINDAQVIIADIMADNGVVHVIDAVLLPMAPPSNTILDIVVNSPDHNTLEAAVLAAGLQDALAGPGPFTVFAPTDAAFAALPAGTIETLLADPTGALTQVLLYHGVAGVALSTDLSNGMMVETLQGQNVTVTINANGVFINDAQVIIADIMADNGVVHVIDAVLVPEQTSVPTTVVDIIVNSPNHNTLETAVIAAGLADDLSADGPFTVFAPTDAAFAALPATLIAQLLADPTGQLTQILLYHVVAGEALSSSLSNGQTITTLQGQDVTVSITGGNVFINDAQVTVADLVADNGVVHVIDAVLTPSISVNETMIQSSMIYPNPASDLLNISTPGLKGSTKFEIYNVTGKLMFGGSLTEMSNSISVATLAQGMYQLKLTNGNEAVSHSFLKN
ncbi:MAG: fasciclin domain-containing protein [Flavobacteriales bacterium]